jgi:predicted naringenin-chalcone synthase
MSVARLASIATAVPPFRMTREDWLAIAHRISPAEVDRALLARLAERSGIEARHCAAFARGETRTASGDDARGADGAAVPSDACEARGTTDGNDASDARSTSTRPTSTRMTSASTTSAPDDSYPHAIDASFYERADRPRTGARVALWSRAARAMAAESAAKALVRAGIVGDAARTRVTHLVTASCTGFESPGIDAHLIATLGLAPTVSRLNVGFMGCHALVNALAAARHAVIAEPHATALVVATEVSSAHFHHSARLDQLVANTLFADGSAAIVVEGRGAGDHGGSGVGVEPTDATGPRVAAQDDARSDAGQGGPPGIDRGARLPAVVATHSVHLAASADEMAWTIGDHGFEMTLGARVPERLEREVGGWVRDALARHGRTVAEVGGWAIHPGGPRVLDAVAASLGLDETALAASRAILRDHGNMSSATLGFILERLAIERAPRPWVALAFGPGLVGEMLLIE